MFLDTVKKQMGILNKLVQFGGLVPLDRALEIGRIIVEWVVVPAHAEEWPERPDEYYISMFGDVVLLFGRAGERERRVSDVPGLSMFKEKEQRVTKWAEQVVDDYAAPNWLIVSSLLRALSPSRGDGWALSEDGANSLRRRLAERLFEVYVAGDGALVSALRDKLFLNYEFLQLFFLHPEYGQQRTRFTQRVIDKADTDDSLRLRSAVILTLVHGDPDPFTELQRKFAVHREQNKGRYDMSLVIPALQRWQDQPLPDPVVAAAFQRLLAEYGRRADGKKGPE
jgi:hypothetical protein